MKESGILKLFRIANESRCIISTAGMEILRSSLNTSKDLAKLYKKAGFKSLDFSMDLARNTGKLLLDNQKGIVRTSSKALNDLIENAKEEKDLSQGFKNMNCSKLKSGAKSKPYRKHISIDEVMN
jgi:hypothetical protein